MKTIKIILISLLLLLISSPVFAEESVNSSNIGAIEQGLDTVWVLFAAFLVFLMQAGFGMVEAGFIRAKNTVNILMKNFLDFCIASIGFFIFGYAIMFGDGNSFFGTTGWLLFGAKSNADIPMYAFWLFQVVFCGAAATIVAGGVAERIKFKSYLIYSFLISAFIYPLIGHWIWGGGWLSKLGFADFAGSTVVHTTGGWAAFVGAYLVGPRLGKYNGNGDVKVISGHSMPLASLGVFLLWFGWFGFNCGSTLGAEDGTLISLIAINTNISAASGALSAMLISWKKFKKPDLSMTMNGSLAGLVAITAPCAFVSPLESIAIGAVGGIIVVYGIILLDKIKVDDPVGAVPVHGINGIWGTLAVGLFGHKALGLTNDGLFHGGGLTQLGIQSLGTFTCCLFVIVSMFLIFKGIKSVVGLRVTRDEELKGLDIGEHGMESYSGFQVFVTE